MPAIGFANLAASSEFRAAEVAGGDDRDNPAYGYYHGTRS